VEEWRLHSVPRVEISDQHLKDVVDVLGSGGGWENVDADDPLSLPDFVAEPDGVALGVDVERESEPVEFHTHLSRPPPSDAWREPSGSWRRAAEAMGATAWLCALSPRLSAEESWLSRLDFGNLVPILRTFLPLGAVERAQSGGESASRIWACSSKLRLGGQTDQVVREVAASPRRRWVSNALSTHPLFTVVRPPVVGEYTTQR